MQERRRFPRAKCFKGARILAPGQPVVACIVRNVGPEGAKIQFSGIVGLPHTFDLCLDNGRRLRNCRVMWRTSNDAGIWFAQQSETQ